MRKPRYDNAFTLVELLVVLAVIGVLLSVVLSASLSARESARTAECRSNLRQIGVAVELLLESQGSRPEFPEAVRMPSVNPLGLPTLDECVAEFAGSSDRLFRCPTDDEFFAQYGLSYEYPGDRLGGKTRPQVLRSEATGEQRGSSRVWIVYDFDHVHGTPGEDGSRNFLYLDGHVDGLVVYQD
ncbi:MAG: prepilin-type N-terminal cleavage/methylation domain-containing protein [Planctomycetota bacterium]